MTCISILGSFNSSISCTLWAKQNASLWYFKIWLRRYGDQNIFPDLTFWQKYSTYRNAIIFQWHENVLIGNCTIYLSNPFRQYGTYRWDKVSTHLGRVTHICVGKLSIIGSENGLSPSRRQAIIWTNAGLLSIGTLQTYFSEILIKIQQFSLKKMHLKMSSVKRRLCCLLDTAVC